MSLLNRYSHPTLLRSDVSKLNKKDRAGVGEGGKGGGGKPRLNFGASTMLYLNGADAATSPTPDAGSVPGTWTLSGAGAQYSTAQFPTGEDSALFLPGGTAAKLECDAQPGKRVLQAPNKRFTLEMWVYLNAAPGASGYVLLSFWSGSSGGWVWDMNSARNMRLAFPYFSAGTITTPTVPIGSWCHVMVSSYGDGLNQTWIGANGVANSFQRYNYGTMTEAGVLTVGYDGNSPTSTTVLNGWVSNVRVTPGVALYQSNPYTPPPCPMPVSVSV